MRLVSRSLEWWGVTQNTHSRVEPTKHGDTCWSSTTCYLCQRGARLNPAREQLGIASQRKFDLNLVWEVLVTKGEITLGLRKQI